uniref:Methyltransferase like 22 n=1 Tax=Cyprinus carpio TaxID=7962 RepID=A0A8C2KAJ8_CYPCA
MDQVTFRNDTVLPDVHLLLPNACHLMKRLNSIGQPGKESRCRETGEDSDEWLCHTSTLLQCSKLCRLSLQIWHGAFLLADFILAQANMFKGATVLEQYCHFYFIIIVNSLNENIFVFFANVGDDLLRMCQRNVTLNKQHFEAQGKHKHHIRMLRCSCWTADDFCTDTDLEFCWTDSEIVDLHDNTTFVIAADVCYDDDLSDALFRTLYRLASNMRHPSTTYISIEKRL